MDDDLETVMDEAGALLNAGDTPAALLMYEGAVNDWPSSSEAHQLYGVCLRMSGELAEADVQFEEAFSLAPSDIQQSKVLRDWSAVALARRNYALAINRLSWAVDKLSSNGKPLKGEARYEYWMTVVFLGEAYWLSGDKTRARASLSVEVYAELKGHAPYELNALMRILPTLSWRARRIVARRAMRLAIEAGNKKRQQQIRVLLALPPLPSWIFRLFR